VKLNSKELRVSEPTEEDLARIKRKPLWFILDNVMDTYNIGGIFRLADAVAARGVILCGGSETPPSSRIHKAAVGTEKWVPWEYFDSAQAAIKKLKSQITDIKIIAVEQDSRSVPLRNLLFKMDNEKPLAIVVGHETDGVSREALEMADVILEIPMWGVNKSLNVIISAGIVTYLLIGNN
jgi:23S rRNA (guanosine2251-2'-O)-methyltransferase